MPDHKDPTPTPAQIARTNMVESQLRPNRVYNGDLLTAMLNVPREAFLPDALKPLAYADDSIGIAPGRYATEPLITARLLEVADIGKADRVLVLGGLTAYVAALAARLAGHVVAVEEDENLRAIGQAALGQLALGNITFQSGTITDGASDDGPFDVIVIDGCVADVPVVLLKQLAPEGRLTTVLARPAGRSQGVVFERVGSAVSHRIVFDGFAPYLPGFEPKPHFEFS